ncbi:MAG: protein phosphatase 2C domain-containing protein [Magnetococcales bacterium]|nr:protein phosphatase 2C domain-containing protein [Magnetococcales bacterium]
MIPGRQFAGNQIQGERQQQQDDFGFYRPDAAQDPPEQLLAVLADGMGGEVGGHEASELVVASFMDAYIVATGNIPSRLEAALQVANQQIAKAVRNNSALQGMGCTLVATVVANEGVYWLSVGDSLLYLVRQGKSRRLNADHSLGHELDEKARRGEITAAEAKNSSNRNMLLSAIIGSPLESVDVPHQAHPLQSGDHLLLASDGLATLTQAEIDKVFTRLADGSAEELSNLLLAAVKEKRRPNQDNTTVLVIAADLPRPPPVILPRRRRSWILGVLAGMFLGAMMAWGVLWMQSTEPPTKVEQGKPVVEKIPESNQKGVDHPAPAKSVTSAQETPAVTETAKPEFPTVSDKKPPLATEPGKQGSKSDKKPDSLPTPSVSSEPKSP